MKTDEKRDKEETFEQQINADRTPRREGGEDSVENIRPSDSRADEKVLANPHGPNNSGKIQKQ